MTHSRLIGMALRDARNLRGLTQKELAKMAAVSRSTIISYEQGAENHQKLPEVLKALELPEEVLRQFVEIYEAMSATLAQQGGEPGRTILDRLLERKAAEQGSVYPQGIGASSMDLAEGGAAGIEQVVRAGARFLRVFLSWMFDSFSPRSQT